MLIICVCIAPHCYFIFGRAPLSWQHVSRYVPDPFLELSRSRHEAEEKMKPRIRCTGRNQQGRVMLVGCILQVSDKVVRPLQTDIESSARSASILLRNQHRSAPFRHRHPAARRPPCHQTYPPPSPLSHPSSLPPPLSPPHYPSRFLSPPSASPASAHDHLDATISPAYTPPRCSNLVDSTLPTTNSRRYQQPTTARRRRGRWFLDERLCSGGSPDGDDRSQ